MRSGRLSFWISTLLIQALPCFALTINLPIEGNVGDPPTVTVNSSPVLGNVAITSGTGSVGLYTNGICIPITTALCITDGGRTAGQITISNPGATPISLTTLATSTNAPWILTNGGSVSTLGAGIAASYYGISLNTGGTSFAVGIGSCTSTLAAGASCTFYLGMQTSGLAPVGSGSTTHSATIQLDLNYT